MVADNPILNSPYEEPRRRHATDDGGVRQVFFCGDDKDEFQKWQKGLANLAADDGT